MFAIHCDMFGGPEVMAWRETPAPLPGAGDVLIKVHAAGLNRADLLQRQGKYPPPEGASPILGLEVAGEITGVGSDVKRWKTGDKVCALLAGGGYAEYAVASAAHCLPVPENLSMTEAAVLPEAVATVWTNVFEAGRLQPNETLFVHGGSSGIGTTAIRLAKLHGARVVVTAGSDEKAAACLRLGADIAINYKTHDFVEEVTRQTGNVNVVLDMLGGDSINRNLQILAPMGRHISIATQQGRTASVDLRLVMMKRLWLTGSTLRARSDAEKARLIAEIEVKAWPWVREGQLKPLIFKTWPIKNAAEAHKVMESSAHIGKMALEVTG